MVNAVPGVLITSDEATIVYILWLNEKLSGPSKFVIKHIDSQRVFVKADKVRYVKDRLADRLAETSFDAGD